MPDIFPLTARVNGVLLKARYDDSYAHSALSPAAVRYLSMPSSVQMAHLAYVGILHVDGIFSSVLLLSSAPGRLCRGADEYDVLLGND